MNTKENRQRFFALYIDQKNILIDKEEKVNRFNVSKFYNWHNEKFFLMLKPVCLISKEDAIEIAKIYGNDEADTFENMVNFAKLIIRRNNSLVSEAVDYLRSKGYALPYIGISVDKLIEYGWIKLI